MIEVSIVDYQPGVAAVNNDDRQVAMAATLSGGIAVEGSLRRLASAIIINDEPLDVLTRISGNMAENI